MKSTTKAAAAAWLTNSKPLTWLELKRKISVKEAAALNNMSEDTFRRRHSHLIKKVSLRLDAVALGEALAIGETEPTK